MLKKLIVSYACAFGLILVGLPSAQGHESTLIIPADINIIDSSCIDVSADELVNGVAVDEFTAPWNDNFLLSSNDGEAIEAGVARGTSEETAKTYWYFSVDPKFEETEQFLVVQTPIGTTYDVLPDTTLILMAKDQYSAMESILYGKGGCGFLAGAQTNIICLYRGVFGYFGEAALTSAAIIEALSPNDDDHGPVASPSNP